MLNGSPIHPYPAGYSRVSDGDIIKEGDLLLGKVRSMCGQESYGWKMVPKPLIGQEFTDWARVPRRRYRFGAPELACA